MNDSRHKLDIYHIDWHIEARGFKKTSIGFQFDRERMFEILGKEIYQGDPYVFLRELLQNSIDAIRMRREILRKHAKIEPGNLGVIRVNVEHLDNKDTIVTWSDDGIGMDEYIIQNYLAVVGKSYYRSPDFEKVGLEMDPISRFGIGILSCFIVANQIEIETYRDPHLLPRSEPLKITIPDQSKQFRVETNPEGCSEIGTTIRVFVESKKISDCDKNNPIDSLNVTEYLSIIAGFVEFPIIINEDDQKTIILHPKQDVVAMKQRFGEDYRVNKLNLSYPWSEAILPQDLATARELLREERFDIKSDLGIEDIEGILAYLVPINGDIDIDPYDGKVEIRDENRISKEKSIRGNQNWSYFSSLDFIGQSRSSKHCATYSVYKDGVLVPNASYPQDFLEPTERFLKPLLLVNLSMKRGPIIDVSRTSFSAGSGFWDAHIHQTHFKKKIDDNLEKLLLLDPLERLYQMGHLVAFHRINPSELWKVFPHEYWPIAFLQSEGHIDAFEFGDISGKQIKLFPNTIVDDFQSELYSLFSRKYNTKDKPEGPLVKWKGDSAVIIDYGSVSYQAAMVLGCAIAISGVPIQEHYYVDSGHFTSPPWDGDPSLIQMVLLPKNHMEESIDISNLLEKAVRNPNLLSSYELSLLNENDSRYNTPHLKFVNFSKPFDRLFAYGTRIMNIKHPVAKDLLRLICILRLSKEHKSLSRELGKLEDSISSYYEMSTLNFLADEKEDTVTNALRYIWQIAKEIKFDFGEIDEQVIPEPDDFVSGTINLDKDIYEKIWNKKNFKDFGEPL